MASKKHNSDGRQPFPYEKFAELWKAGKPLLEITKALGKFDPKAEHPLNAITPFLYRARKFGWEDAEGKKHYLPYRNKEAKAAHAKAAAKAAKKRERKPKPVHKPEVHHAEEKATA